MGNKVRIFVGAVLICAVGATATVALTGDPNALHSAEAALCFACLGVFAEFLSYNVASASYRATTVSIPFLATIFLAPTWVSLAFIAGVSLVVAIIIRKGPPLKGIFNIAQFVLSSAIAIGIYRALGGTPWLVRLEFNWIAYLTTYLAFGIVNNVLVTTVVTFEHGKNHPELGGV